VIPAGNLNDAARLVHDPSLRPDENTVVESIDDSLENFSPAPTPGRVDVLSYSANEWAVRVESPGEALLVNTDTNYPGWEAAIDGHPARIYTADVAFRAIRLPPGNHEVRMLYVPRILYWSAALSALALMAALLAIARGLRTPS